MEEEKRTLSLPGGSSFCRAGWALFAANLIPILLALLAGGLKDRLMLENSLIRWAISFVPMYGFGIPLGMWILSKLPKDNCEPKKMTAGDLLKVFVMTYPLTLGGSILGNLMAALLSGGRSVNNVLEIVSRQDPLIMMTMVVIAPIMEELIFRKLLIDRTVRFGEKNAILFSALAFGLFHGNIYQIFYAFAVGLLFGYVYVRTRNIRYTMLLHFGINFMSGVVGALLIGLIDKQFLQGIMTGDTETLMELMEADPQRIMNLYLSMIPLMIQELVIFGLAIGGIALLGIHKSKFVFLPAPEEIEKGSRIRTIYWNVGVIAFTLLCIIETVVVLIRSCV